MKVKELTKEHEGRRIKVTGVADSAVEHQEEMPKDSKRLKHAIGTISKVNITVAGTVLQAWVEWEDQSAGGPGSLMLAPEDEVEFIANPLTTTETANADTLLRAAQNGHLAVLRSREIATGKDVALLCAMSSIPGSLGAAFVPLAVLVDGNPYELYESPDLSMSQERESQVILPTRVARP